MTEMPGVAPDQPCQCGPSFESFCICGPSEKQLRKVSAGGAALSLEQREWCLEEIRSCGDATDQGGFEDSGDSDLARQVLSAWRDYARDKGTLS